jgi:hypothetical protein
MGTSMVEARDRKDWPGISCQNRWDGVIFGGHPTARIFVQARKPARGSVYNAHWSVQSKGVMIAQRLKSTNARGQMVYFDNSLRRVEKNGWVFAEAPRAWAAVKVAAGGTTWEPDTPKQHPSGAEGAAAPYDGGPPNPGTWLVLKDEFSPVVIEVVRKKDCPTMEDFQKAILAGRFKWELNRLDYRSSRYKTTVSLFANYSHSPLVDGKTVDYKPAKVFDCPFIQSEFGSGVVRLRYGDRKETLKFTK